MAETGRAALIAGGADVTTADHAGGHQITQDELTTAREWIAQVTATEGRIA
jgi:predicted esterase